MKRHISHNIRHDSFSDNSSGYIGRFAPSPTGNLHFGSLLAAVGSFLQARAHGGRWLIRMEDIDPPREVRGSADRILADLARFGMQSDQPVLFQSTRTQAYATALKTLLDSGQAFHCACSRKQIPENGIYPGTCRNAVPAGQSARSIRLKTNTTPIQFTDRVMGPCRQNIRNEVGDFVIRRADGQAAYHLAVVVDDAFQRVTEMVRGADLLDSTPRQIWLQRCLGLPTPGYLHLPLVLNQNGVKLSKLEQSDPIRNTNPATAVFAALHCLGQNPPAGLSLEKLWDWALGHWQADAIPRDSITAPLS